MIRRLFRRSPEALPAGYSLEYDPLFARTIWLYGPDHVMLCGRRSVRLAVVAAHRYAKQQLVIEKYNKSAGQPS